MYAHVDFFFYLARCNQFSINMSQIFRLRLGPDMRKDASEGDKVYYVTPRARGKITHNELARQVMQTTIFSVADVKASLRNLSIFIANALRSGQSVSLDGLGTIYISASSAAVADSSELSASKLKKVQIRFEQTTELREAAARVSFQIDQFSYNPQP